MSSLKNINLPGKVTPPPIPSSTRIKTTGHTPKYAAGGVNNVHTTLIKTAKNITHLAENNSATLAPGICRNTSIKNHEKVTSNALPVIQSSPRNSMIK